MSPNEEVARAVSPNGKRVAILSAVSRRTFQLIVVKVHLQTANLQPLVTLVDAELLPPYLKWESDTEVRIMGQADEVVRRKARKVIDDGVEAIIVSC